MNSIKDTSYKELQEKEMNNKLESENFTQFYSVLSINKYGFKFHEFLYKVKDLEKASKEFKQVLMDYENVVLAKSGDFLGLPTYKVLSMKRKLAKWEKKEGIKRYSLLEVYQIHEKEKCEFHEKEKEQEKTL